MLQSSLTTQSLRRIRGSRVEKAAAIDIGSNAIRLVIGGFDESGRVQVYRKLREPVRLGKDVFDKSRMISIDSITQSLKAFEKFKKIIADQGIRSVRAVATSAVRDAANGQEFVDIIDKAHGIKIEVIDGVEEAKLIQNAVDLEVGLQNRASFLLDIGGGSVELTLLDGPKTVYVESFKLGTVRLLKVIDKDKLSNNKLEDLIAETLRPAEKALEEFSKKRKIDICIGTGGNVECLGVIRANFLNKNSTSKLYLEELEKIIKKLDQMSYKERVEKWHLRPDRADVIFPASMIVKRVLEIAKTETLLIPRVGLKDGILLDLLKKASSLAATTTLK